MSFYKLGIKGDMVYALEQMHIDSPTPIQTLSIPKIFEGIDLLAEAQTGTGKTLAFLLPIFQMIDAENPNIQCLIITPTRELAIQITEVANQLATIKPIHVLTAYGGQDVNAQLHKLKDDIQMVIGTPGRILDHLRRESISFENLKTFVVDEADQMFHIGFKEEVKDIMKTLPKERQTLCFSATLSHKVDSFANHYLNHPVRVTAPKEQITLDTITQCVLETSNRKKFEHFMKLISQDIPEKAIIFCRSRIGTQTLYEEMLEKGLNVDTLHGGLTQAKREFVMSEFKEDRIKYLVATDVAARGLDVDGVSHVYNYNLPDDIENYVHRIGRTGRAGKGGVSYIIMTQKDEKRLEAVEEFINMKIDRIRYEEEKPRPITKQKTKSSSSSANTKKTKPYYSKNKPRKKK